MNLLRLLTSLTVGSVFVDVIKNPHDESNRQTADIYEPRARSATKATFKKHCSVSLKNLLHVVWLS